MIRYLIIILTTITLTIALLSSPKLLNQVLERNLPEIEILTKNKGLGLTPSKLELLIKDDGSGLDAAIVRVYQRSKSIVIFKQDFEKQNQVKILVDLPDKTAGLEEGLITLEIRAFDKSFWNNVAEKRVELFVDFVQPELELLSTQHNVRKGGAQLALYKCLDKNLAVHGIRVGNKNFLGFPIKNIDTNIETPDYYAAIFSLPSNFIETESIKVFAEDAVGNAISRKLPVNILKAHQRQITKLINSISINAINPDLKTAYASLKDFIEKSTAVELENILKNNTQVISGRAWNSEFMKFPGQALTVVGDELHFQDSKTLIALKNSDFYEIDLSEYKYNVPALQAGIVNYIGQSPIFGDYLFINHGLGLFSFYANLDQVSVKTNDQVEQGDTLGNLGTRAAINVRLIKPRSLYYQLFAQEQATDPREWWELSWYNDHIEAKLNDLKTELGIITLKGDL